MAESEWWLTGGEASRRLDALLNYWNGLQNAALGRGVEPIAPMALADEVVTLNEAFHAWRSTLEGVTFVSSMADELALWTRKANETRAKLAAAHVPNLPLAATEWVQTGPSQIVTGALAAGVLLLALIFALRRGT